MDYECKLIAMWVAFIERLHYIETNITHILKVNKINKFFNVYLVLDNRTFLGPRRACDYSSLWGMAGCFPCIAHCNAHHTKRCCSVCIYLHDGERCVPALVHHFSSAPSFELLHQVCKFHNFWSQLYVCYCVWYHPCWTDIKNTPCLPYKLSKCMEKTWGRGVL